MRPSSTQPPATETPTGPPSRDVDLKTSLPSAASSPVAGTPAAVPDRDEHEGATEDQIGDLTGPAAGYDSPAAKDKAGRRQPGVGS
jgi:hypothetical protein